MKLSIVIPLYNEAPNLNNLLTNLRRELVMHKYEVILVDDGSTDNTIAQVKALHYNHFKVLVLNRNYGQTTAMKAGIDAAQGEYIVTMDGDMQNDPSDIPLLLNKVQLENWDVVAGYRLHRQDALLYRKLPSRIANSLIRFSTGIKLRDYGCSLKIFKASVAKNLELYGELHRFIPVLAHIQGAKITEIPVRHHPRTRGRSKYGISRVLKVASDLLLMLFFLKYWAKAMHLFGSAGILTFLAGSGMLFYLLIVKLLGADVGDRPLLNLGVLMILAGIQFVFFGFIAEMLLRLKYKSKNTTPYHIKEVYEAPECKQVADFLA